MPRRSTISAEGRRRTERRDAADLLDGRPAHLAGADRGVPGAEARSWQIKQDPNARNFQVDNLGLPVASALSVLQERRSFFDEIESQRDSLSTFRGKIRSDLNATWPIRCCSQARSPAPSNSA